MHHDAPMLVNSNMHVLSMDMQGQISTFLLLKHIIPYSQVTSWCHLLDIQALHLYRC